MFRITDHKGFQMEFTNGFRISVQFGPANYCEQYRSGWDAPRQSDYWECKNAEIAIFAPDGSMLELPGEYPDTVKGYCESDFVGKLIGAVASLPPDAVALPAPAAEIEA